MDNVIIDLKKSIRDSLSNGNISIKDFHKDVLPKLGINIELNTFRNMLSDSGSVSYQVLKALAEHFDLGILDRKLVHVHNYTLVAKSKEPNLPRRRVPIKRANKPRTFE